MVNMPSFRLPPLPARHIAPAAFVVATLASVLIAWGAAVVVEGVSARAVRSLLMADGVTFATVEATGLQIRLTGTAPNEAERYRVVNLVGSLIDSSRIRDRMEVTPVKAIEAPNFSVEMLRNDDGIQLIGLLPQGDAKAVLSETAQALNPDIPLAEMLETAKYDAPKGWDSALDFSIAALKLLPRSKISVAADHVSVTAIAGSEAEKRSFEKQLAELKPAGLLVSLDISSPRPVLTPFTLRFVKDADGARFDACSADTEQARARIIAAGALAGVLTKTNCVIGLGVPSPSWATATIAGIDAVAQLGNATVTFKDADVTLLAASAVPQADFDRIVGELETALPDLFSLKATLEKKQGTAVSGPAEFTASMAAETHRVELRGRLTDGALRAAVESFASAEFGAKNIYLATRMDPELPDGWPVRVLSGLQALAELDHGTLLVRDDTVEVTGVTGSQSAKVRISQILSNKLGQGATFKVNVSYDKELDPIASIPTPEECAQDVDDILARQKITFTPGSAEIDSKAGAVMRALADVLVDCPGIRMEIAGFTDSQGSDGGNLALSQARAETVLLSLQGRQVDVSGMVPKGYGEANPLADNSTEAGREANRRIEFHLLAASSKPVTPDQAALAGSNGEAVDAAAPAAAATSATPDFSADTSPSVAPTKKTIRPQTRPEKDE